MLTCNSKSNSQAANITVLPPSREAARFHKQNFSSWAQSQPQFYKIFFKIQSIEPSTYPHHPISGGRQASLQPPQGKAVEQTARLQPPLELCEVHAVNLGPGLLS